MVVDLELNKRELNKLLFIIRRHKKNNPVSTGICSELEIKVLKSIELHEIISQSQKLKRLLKNGSNCKL